MIPKWKRRFSEKSCKPRYRPHPIRDLIEALGFTRARLIRSSSGAPPFRAKALDDEAGPASGMVHSIRVVVIQDSRSPSAKHHGNDDRERHGAASLRAEISLMHTPARGLQRPGDCIR